MSAISTPGPSRPSRQATGPQLTPDQRAIVARLLTPLPPNAKSFVGLARHWYDEPRFIDLKAPPADWVKRFNYHPPQVPEVLDSPDMRRDYRAKMEYLCRGLSDAIDREMDPKLKQAKAVIRKIRKSARGAS